MPWPDPHAPSSSPAPLQDSLVIFSGACACVLLTNIVVALGMVIVSSQGQPEALVGKVGISNTKRQVPSIVPDLVEIIKTRLRPQPVSHLQR